MKRTKNNCIAIAKEIRSDMLHMAHMHKKQGDDIEYSKAIREVIGMDIVIQLLTDNNYFDRMCEIYNVE